MILLVSTAAVLLTPVALTDPVLEQSDTFISEGARAAMADGSVTELHCLDLPQDHPDGARACLTATEWQAVFDRIAHQQSADRRMRAISQAQFAAGRPSYP